MIHKSNKQEVLILLYVELEILGIAFYSFITIGLHTALIVSDKL